MLPFSEDMDETCHSYADNAQIYWKISPNCYSTSDTLSASHEDIGTGMSNEVLLNRTTY